MRTLSVFNNISLDGYFTDADNDMSWAHRGADAEFQKFTQKNASGDSTLVFGRKTYDLMVQFWPTPAAKQTMPKVADKMNNAEKIVFSRTLKKPTWNNTKVIGANIVGKMRKLKAGDGPSMVMMGSGEIVSQFAQAGLIDEYQFVVCPIVLGGGRTLFETVKKPVQMHRTEERAFGNGNVFVRYRPA